MEAQATNLKASQPKFSALSDPALFAGWRRANFTAAAIFLAFLVIAQSEFREFFSVWTKSSLYHHGLAVAPISLWLIARRQDWRTMSPRTSWAGVGLLLLALALWLFGEAGNVALFGHIGIVLAAIAAVMTAYGVALSRLWAFPLGFLFFMIPTGDVLTTALQTSTSIAASALLNAAGIANTHEGFILVTAASPFVVAESCAGLRFLLAATIVSALASHLSGMRARMACLFIVGSAATALVGNWIRVTLIVALSTATEMKIGVGPEHVAIGWIFYAVLILLILLSAKKLAPVTPDRQSSFDAADRRERPAVDAPSMIPMIVACSAIVAAGVYAQSINSPPAFAAPRPMIDDAPTAGWRRTAPTLHWDAFAPDADASLAWAIESSGIAIDARMAWFDYDRQGAEIGGYRLRAADDVNWRVVGATTRQAEIDGRKQIVRIETLARATGEKIDVVTVYFYGRKLHLSPTALKAQIALDRMAGRPFPGGALFFAAPSTVESAQNLIEALEDLEHTHWRALPISTSQTALG